MKSKSRGNQYAGKKLEGDRRFKLKELKIKGGPYWVLGGGKKRGLEILFDMVEVRGYLSNRLKNSDQQRKGVLVKQERYQKLREEGSGEIAIWGE